MQCKFCTLSNEIMLYRIRSILPKFYNRVQLQTDLHHSRSTSHKIFSCTIQVITQFHRNLYLLPATKLGQGYVFTRVCDSVHVGRWCLPQCMLGYTPSPGADTPQEQTPQSSACWEIWATSGWYVSYWNAYLFQLKICVINVRILISGLN